MASNPPTSKTSVRRTGNHPLTRRLVLPIHSGVMGMGEIPEDEELQLLDEHRDLFERLARSDLPISEDAARGLAYLDAEVERDE